MENEGEKSKRLLDPLLIFMGHDKNFSGSAWLLACSFFSPLVTPAQHVALCACTQTLTVFSPSSLRTLHQQSALGQSSSRELHVLLCNPSFSSCTQERGSGRPWKQTRATWVRYSGVLGSQDRKQSVGSRWSDVLGPVGRGMAGRRLRINPSKSWCAGVSSAGAYWLDDWQGRGTFQSMGSLQASEKSAMIIVLTLFPGNANYSPPTRQLQLALLRFQLRTAMLQRLIENVVIPFCLGRHTPPACQTCMPALEFLPLKGRGLPCSYPCWLSPSGEQALQQGSEVSQHASS